MSKQVNNFFINCHACNYINDISKTIYILNRGEKEHCGQSCEKCKTIMTIVITEQGARILQKLFIDKN